MIIQNLRLGFATNSSSSHSVVLIPDNLIGSIRDDGDQCGEFGWSFFTLSSPESKIRYIASQMFSAFRNQADFDTIANKVVSVSKEFDENFPISSEEITEDNYDIGYVDHQSAINFSNYDEKTHRALLHYFMSENVVVLGGNDNADDRYNDIKDAVDSPFNSFMEYGQILTRVDGDALTLFSPVRGTKVRLIPDGMTYSKSETPELVDLKITDFCDKGCKFCYQSSTTTGKHASLEKIKHIIDMLSAMQVFEIAIGGGEPTSHPDFAEILRYAREKNVVPNFTTFSDDWLANDELTKSILVHVGAIGVSVTNEKGLELYNKIANAMRYRHNNYNVTAQHVVGSVPIQVTLKLIEAAKEGNIPLLLLGYKNVGFGATFNPHLPSDTDMSVMAKLIMSESNDMRLSVDTALVDAYPKFIEALAAPEALVSSPEGAFSCYVDAVTDQMGKSSYEPVLKPLPMTVEGFMAQFATYSGDI